TPVHAAFPHHLAAPYGAGAYAGPLYSFPRTVGDYAHALLRQDPLGKTRATPGRRGAATPSLPAGPSRCYPGRFTVKTWFQNRRAKWRRLKQENPQAAKKEEAEGADGAAAQRPESCGSPERGGAEVPLDGPQFPPSPASHEELESELSDDSDQEVDIEGDKGYYNSAA
ncbi:HHEX protein, partial [Eudromia elegans]|nr:HHEX protein [Eudromia elegans]